MAKKKKKKKKNAPPQQKFSLPRNAKKSGILSKYSDLIIITITLLVILAFYYWSTSRGYYVETNKFHRGLPFGTY